jgi:hypothetical protein
MIHGPVDHRTSQHPLLHHVNDTNHCSLLYSHLSQTFLYVWWKCFMSSGTT